MLRHICLVSLTATDLTPETEDDALVVFDEVARHGHEQIVYGYDEVSGLKAIIAIHFTSLGPALGGTRFFPYKTEQEALEDVLRLSEGMTYKAAAAGLDLGGGKAVIIGDPRTDKSERLFRAYGRIVDSLGGRYVTAEDMGTTPADLDLVRRETRWALGNSIGFGGAGDPSPDFFTPCALGASLNEATIPLLNCQAIVGSANNQLATEQDASRLADRGILYAPDFVVNAGGLINVYDELLGYSKMRALQRVDSIYEATLEILKTAKELGVLPHEAAVQVAKDRINRIGDLQRFRTGDQGKH